jgi:polysaccharide biosynthesis protein PslH
VTGAPGRALLITKTDPTEPRDGGTLRVAAVVSALRGAGWTVDVVPARTAAGTRRTDLPPVRGRRATRAAARVALEGIRAGSVSIARWIDPRVAAQIARLRAIHRYDLGVVEFSQLLVYRGLLGRTPVLLDLHNLEAELLANYAGSADSPARRAAARWEAARLRSVEGRASLRRVDSVITVSERERAHVAGLVDGTAVAAAPNGVADAAFEVEKRPSRPPVVVFIAHLGWQPNVDAVRWLVERVWPIVVAQRPELELHLIGRSPAPAVAAFDGVDGVRVVPDVPSTLPHLAAATVATAPLQAAGGTRLKILEALATGTPVVATPLGAMGLEHLDGAGLDVEESPEAFAAALLRRIDDPGDPAAIRAAVEPYRWSNALQPLLGAAEAIGANEDRT